MKYCRMLVVALLLTCISTLTFAESYPEFTGNYYLCGKEWCEIQHQQLNTMQLLIISSSGRYTVGYGGYFEIADTLPTIQSKKPRFLFYMGRENVDPRYTALVELAPMEYNNAPISVMDGTDYQMRTNYNANTANQLWTFKREIPVRFKPIEGKTGMFIVEPSAPLADGFYAIDYGVPGKSGHSGLRTAPEPMGFQKTMNVQTAIPFIIGNKSQIASQAATRNQNQRRDNTENSQQNSQGTTIDVGEAAGNLIKGLFGN